MRPNYLSAEKDVRVLLAAMKLARRIAERQPLAAAIVEEHGPGPGVATDDQIVDFLRATALSIQHMCGTCKMGTDEHAVVDPTLRVHGMDGLRVADASIMPTLVSGNTNAPTIMIGERAADFIRRG
jgi:choline dehydrogenase